MLKYSIGYFRVFQVVLGISWYFRVFLGISVYFLNFSNSLDRQVTERVNIENFRGEILMNRRNEMGGVRLERMQYRRWGGN